MMREEMNAPVTDAPVGDGYADYFEYLGDELKLLTLRFRKGAAPEGTALVGFARRDVNVIVEQKNTRLARLFLAGH